MTRKKVYLKLSHAANNTVLVKAESIASMVLNNPDFPSPTPTIADLEQDIHHFKDAIVHANTAWTIYKERLMEIKQQKENLLNQLQKLRNYVDNITDGDEAKILSAGFSTRKKNTRNGRLDAPINLLAKEGINAGEVIATWRKISDAKSYLIEITDDINDKSKWKFFAAATKTKHTINKLKSGSVIWVRVAAINAAGQGAYSDPAMKVVP